MKTCPTCGKEFEPKREWQRFCSARCRYRGRWQKFRVVPVGELQHLAEIANHLLTHDSPTPH